jgi:hypothetical protein
MESLFPVSHSPLEILAGILLKNVERLFRDVGLHRITTDWKDRRSLFWIFGRDGGAVLASVCRTPCCGTTVHGASAVCVAVVCSIPNLCSEMTG